MKMPSKREIDRERWLELRSLGAQLAYEERKRDEAIKRRNEMICETVAAGVSQAEVARWCGLSRATVSTIVRRGKEGR